MSRALALVAVLALLPGCAGNQFAQSLAQTNQDTAAITHGELQLATTGAARGAMAARAAEILQQPLSANDAIQLALQNNPAWQALLAEHWSDAAQAAQAGRIANPLFGLTRVTSGNALDFERSLSFGLLDLLQLPQRQQMAQQRLAQAQLGLSAQVLEQVTLVRQAWVRAVAAQQSLAYARQVFDSAEASAELARRLQAAGNFSKLMRARQHAYYADAATGLALAQQDVTATREALVRALGLTQSQAEQMQLPSRLPDLPAMPRTPDEVAASAGSNRLDLRMAQAALAAAVKAQGLNWPASLMDIELGVRRDTHFANDGSVPNRSSGHGFEFNLRLPLFDSGNLRRDAMNAQTLAQASRLEALTRSAGSSLRESYSAYRSSYDIARHYRQEIVPLRKTILDENVLRYNGMLSNVFELLSDARAQVNSVLATINAEQQFWLMDAALQANILGQPVMAGAMNSRSMQDSGGNDGGH